MEEIVIIGICLFANGLLSCFEMAFVSVTKPQLRQLARNGIAAATRILHLRENPERTLSIVQIGITLVGMISAAVGGAGAEEALAPYFEKQFAVSENVAEAIAILLVVVPLTLASVVLGELVPKTIALRNPVQISLLGARWILLAEKLFSPLVSFLELATKYILQLFTRNAPPSPGLEGAPAGEIDHLSKSTQQYVLNLVRVETSKIKDCMVDWDQVNVVREEDSPDQISETIINSGHTRLPVLRGAEVIGILHTKEFIALLSSSDKSWQSLIRPVLVVQSEDFALSALRLMQNKRSHLCIVKSSTNGAPLGIITLEDVIEEIVGELYDEDDDGKIRHLLAESARWRSRPRPS